MNTKVFFAGILLIGLGIGFIWDYVQIYRCRLRKSHIYLIGAPVSGYRFGPFYFDYRSGPFGLSVMGLGSISVGMGLLLPLTPYDTLQFLMYISGPLILLGLVLMIRQPPWVRPPWLTWMLEYHYDILTLLANEAYEDSNWSQRINSQSDLEEWVAEIREKHNLSQPKAL